MKLTFATFILKKVLFSCERIWMSSGGGPDPLDPPLIYATVYDYESHNMSIFLSLFSYLVNNDALLEFLNQL
jgi:hypothetical protein